MNTAAISPFEELVKEEESKLPEELRQPLRSYLQHAANDELNVVSNKLGAEAKSRKNDFEVALQNLERKLEA